MHDNMGTGLIGQGSAQIGMARKVIEGKRVSNRSLGGFEKVED